MKFKTKIYCKLANRNFWLKKYTGNISLAIAKPLIIAIAAMYLFFLKIFLLIFVDLLTYICYIRYLVNRECYFQVTSSFKIKKRFVGSIFYEVFAMKSEPRMWRFKLRTSSLLTDVLSVKPVCQKAGVTEILTFNYFFNQTQDSFAELCCD